MSITCSSFVISGHQKPSISIKCTGDLNSVTAADIRKAVGEYIHSGVELIYIDAKAAKDADLPGINEIIHSHYTLSAASIRLIFLYQQGSAVDKWVNTTGINKFLHTAIVPAS